MEPAIVIRHRTPRISGSRINVYDVLAETQAGATPEELAEWYHLDVAQIHCALRYIEEHKEEVLSDFREIKERHARGNPPEIQAILEEIHVRFLAKVKEREQARTQERVNGRNSRGS